MRGSAALEISSTQFLEERVKDLEDLLAQRNVTATSIAFGLSETQARMFGLLLSLPAVPASVFETRLGITAHAKVAINRLRKKLIRYGIPIVTNYSVGYSITPEKKTEARARIARTLDGME